MIRSTSFLRSLLPSRFFRPSFSRAASSSLLAGIGILLHLVSAGSAKAQPVGDHFAGHEAQELSISLEKLLGNDSFTSSAFQPVPLAELIEIVLPPRYGTLAPTKKGSALLYIPDRAAGAPTVGRDRFEYRLDFEGAPEGTATVTLDIRPEWSPVVGRWFADAPAGEARGLFHSQGAFFRLCRSKEGIVCHDLSVASEHRLWAPLSIDLDGDGLHELMLHDARFGTLVTFGFEEDCEDSDGLCLREIDRRSFGQPGEVAVVGSNFFGEVWFGLFAPTSGRWQLQRAAGDPTVTTLYFAPSAGEPVPLLTAWNNGHEVTPGIFDPETGLLHTLNSLFSGASRTFDPGLWSIPIEPYLVTNGQPVDPIVTPLLMLFERYSPTIHMYNVYQYVGGQVYTSVPTDPSGLQAPTLPGPPAEK